MLAFNKIRSSPTGAMRGVTLEESRDVSSETGQTNLPNPESEHAFLIDADALSQAGARTQRRSGFQRMGRTTLLKPLIAVATTQYVLVTALAAVAAFMVASGAGKAVNAKLAPIIVALRRF